MDKKVKTAIMFLCSTALLTGVFGLILRNYLVGLGIGVFLSLSFFYDPKKIKERDTQIKKEEEKSKEIK